MKKRHEKVKVVLKRSQKEMKRYTDRNRKMVVEYKVKDRVLLSTKNLVWQMRNRKMKKLMEKFIGLYEIKLENTIELELLALIKIHLVVNVSRIVLYWKQVKKQKKILSSLIKIDGKKEYEVEKILNRRDMKEKPKYLVRQKEYTVNKICERDWRTQEM